ncbi:hypothetical protein OG884_08330 [Streptosporangium sp. NBC_01755]|uniref:hypothetical protein n=1 Tax=Streptosporangium sp. NBC_01755 TaxID=2975949 RepID=UPI002DDC2551|nr:hypothetical protein [Streptosporangium sp. NBC_01755]WSD01911.1 hypothetical protein OG884_08330 [Streptosporangium sp. NBC_01755]
MAPEAGSGRSLPNIAMWGAPGSGKTTLLAALNIALLRQEGNWSIVGADAQSTSFLTEKTTALSRDKVFPPATQGLDNYNWFLVGQPERRRARWFRRSRMARALKIGINPLDPPGGAFGDKEGGGRASQQDLLRNLVHSRGILFLFDPIRENEDGDAFEYLYGVLAQLAEQVIAGSEVTDGRLPHYLAVCITKFDDFKVLETAKRLRLLTTDPEDPFGFPRVADEDAKELFQQLCRVSASGNADMVLNAIGRFFREDRIRYFVTSSIGFYVGPRNKLFDMDDYQNLVPTVSKPADGQPVSDTRYNTEIRIRGEVRPINVMEPMLWLGQRISVP